MVTIAKSVTLRAACVAVVGDHRKVNYAARGMRHCQHRPLRTSRKLQPIAHTRAVLYARQVLHCAPRRFGANKAFL